MANSQDTITSRVPQHIVEQYPNFVEFLKAYYEWLNQPGNPHYQVRHHMDFLSFDESMDDYVDFLQREFLHKLPQDVYGDKELFIQWSKKFGLARGSHESYKFLFRMLFGEQDTEIYLPKENILKTSDGTWVSNRKTLIVTNPGNPEDLLYSKIKQIQPVFEGISEEATAVVESYRTIFTNGVNVLELVLVDTKGDFILGQPITTVSNGFYVWPVPTVSSFDIESAGQNYFRNEWVSFKVFDPTYVHEDLVREAGVFDTRMTTVLSEGQVRVYKNGTQLESSDYFYDGQFLTSDLFTIGSTIRFEADVVTSGIVYIKDVDAQGGVIELGILEPAIGVQDAQLGLVYDLQPEAFMIDDYYQSEFTGTGNNIEERGFRNKYINVYQSATYSEGYVNEEPYPVVRAIGLGSGFVAYANQGVDRELPGYYIDDKGWLSSTMVLQDSDYYQNYSYVIQTQQNITKYADIVKEVLHPAGFKFFGNVRIFLLIELMIGIDQQETGHFIPTREAYSLAEPGIGNNYEWIAKTDTLLSPRMYKGTEWDQVYVDGDVDYDLTNKQHERLYKYNETNQPLVISKRGWLTSLDLVDGDIRQPQNYFEESNFDSLYVESSFLVDPSIDETGYINTYINTFSVFDYSDTEYVE